MILKRNLNTIYILLYKAWYISFRKRELIVLCTFYHQQLKFWLLKITFQALITQTRAKQAATMSEVEWRGRTVPVKIDKVRIFLLGLADNEAAIAQVRGSCPFSVRVCLKLSSCVYDIDGCAFLTKQKYVLLLFGIWSPNYCKSWARRRVQALRGQGNWQRQSWMWTWTWLWTREWWEAGLTWGAPCGPAGGVVTSLWCLSDLLS